MAVLFMNGCAIMSKDMVHPDGRKTDCKTWGIGWLGAPAAIVMHYDCVNRAEKEGFVRE